MSSFSVSLICFTSCAVAARGTNRTNARTAKNNRPRNLRRVDIAYPFRMNDSQYQPCLRQYFASIAARGRTVLRTVAKISRTRFDLASAAKLVPWHSYVARRCATREPSRARLLAFAASFPIALTERAPPQSVCVDTSRACARHGVLVEERTADDGHPSCNNGRNRYAEARSLTVAPDISGHRSGHPERCPQ
jgi:hypothetical protein